MDFFDQIIKNGCSIKCYFDDFVNYPNRIGFQLTTPHNLDLHPSYDEIDNEFWLLFAIFGLKILDVVSDPFSYDIEKRYGVILINNVRYEINLPTDIVNLLNINNYQHFNNYNFDLIHNQIIDLILEKINHNIKLKTLYYDLIILDEQQHYIMNLNDNDENSENSENSENENQYQNSDNSFRYRVGYAKILKSLN